MVPDKELFRVEAKAKGRICFGDNVTFGCFLKNILVTGATGFVGQALVTKLLAEKFSVSALVRSETAYLPSDIRKVIVPDLVAQTEFQSILHNVEVVIHTAGRAHIMNDDVTNSLDEFRKVNTDATLRLAKQAAEADVKRFIFISSIGVNGTFNSKPFVEADNVNPQEFYAVSKYEAEQGLLALAKGIGMEVVIIRPPLVYGASAPGNFGSLVRWMKKGVPLPFGAIYNKRSLVALDNLVNFIIHCIDHPKAANEVFLISDGEDVSTTQLLSKVAKAYGKKTCLIPVPVSWMTFTARLVGKADVANRLFSSLQVDSAKARDLLGWKSVVTMDEQLKKVVEVYLNKKEV